MRLGVVDVGSNTVHLLVVDAHRGAQPLPATSHRIELRLSEHVTEDGRIAASGADALVHFIDECLRVAEDLGVEELMSFATSATREAPNGPAVLERVAAETGCQLEVLSGEEEARRLVRQRLAGAPRPLAKAGAPDGAVGTSKTMRSLARVLGAASSAEGSYAARRLERAALGGLVERLVTMRAVERAALPGVSEGRSAQLLAGALVAEAAMDLLSLDALEICPWALREGIILSRLDWIA